MSCHCIPCTALRIETPSITVENSRAHMVPKDVWRIIFSHLELKDKIASSLTCKKWRHLLSGFLANQPYYNIGSFKCFTEFNSHFLKSRHFILLDATCSMEKGSQIVNSSVIFKKLLNYLEPVIKDRGLFMGHWDNSCTINYLKTKGECISYVHNLDIIGYLMNFSVVVKSISARLKDLDSDIPTQIHIISDMVMHQGSSMFSYPFPSNVTFHFFCFNNVKKHKFLTKVVENSKEKVEEGEPETKRRKKEKKVECLVYPLAKNLVHPEHRKSRRNHIRTVKKPHFFVPPKRGFIV